MTLVNVLDNEFLDIPDELVDVVRFVVYVKMDERLVLNLDENCPVQRRRICDPTQLEL
jgi:hypothetical protein